jgi:aromatic-L-amino-acid decarboxylase
MDPAAPLADISERERLWLHVDAAYAGTGALLPELRPLFDGWERADSIVVNPHKWMFTPFDASLLLFRRPEVFHEAFSVVPEYIKTPDQGPVRNYSEYGVQMGRRFRALKLWMQIRYFGVEGIVARLREHCRMARELVGWIEAEPGWELTAPAPFATVCLRHNPFDVGAGQGEGGGPADDATEARIDRINEAILAEVNRSGKIFLSHTRLAGRYTVRVCVGNPRQTMDHLRSCWELLRAAAKKAVAEER